MSDQKFHNVGLVPAMVQQNFIDSNDQGAAEGIAFAIANPINSLSPFSDGSDGRVPRAVPPAATGAFRTPGLRCATMRPTFMHTGQIPTLADVVSFFSSGGASDGIPGTNEISALDLTGLEQSDLVAFLESLTGPGADPKYLQAP
jgi:cytochrome c peroxidase